jgi:hypothetical protein
MSELGYSRPKWAVHAMSGLPPLATELRTSLEVRIVPQADRLTVRNAPSLDGLFLVAATSHRDPVILRPQQAMAQWPLLRLWQAGEPR